MTHEKTVAQDRRIHRILNAGRRRLLDYVYAQANRLRQKDPVTASEAVRIAEMLHGFGKPRWRATERELAAIHKETLKDTGRLERHLAAALKDVRAASKRR